MFPADGTSQPLSHKVSTSREWAQNAQASKSTAAGLQNRNVPIENNKTGDKSRTKKDRALSFLLSSFLRLPRAKSHKRSSNLARNSTEQTTTSCSAHQSAAATATATLKSTDRAAHRTTSANAPGNSHDNCGASGPDHDSSAVHPVAMRTNSQPKMTSQHSRTPSEASCAKKASVASQRLSVGSQFDAAQCAPTCTVPFRSRAAVKLDAALLCLERVAEYLQQIISRQMVTLLPGLCTVLFEILEEIYHFAFCGQSRVSGLAQSELPGVNESTSSFKRQKSLCASLLALIRELDVLLIDFYGDQLRPKPPTNSLGNDKAKRTSLQNVRHASALIIARHKTELERHIFELVGIAKQSTATADSATTDQPLQTTMAHSGNVHTATSGLSVPSAANTSGLTDDELGEQINMLSRKIHHLASNFRRISNSDSVETQSANSSMHNSMFLSNSNMLPNVSTDDGPNGAKLAPTENNATALRDLENKHIVIEQIEVRTTERPDENTTQTHPENAAKLHADCSDAHVERQACVEPTTVTELQERVEYDTVIGEDGRTYRRKRIIRKHVSTTHECEIIYSKKEQKVTPAMFLEDDHSGEQQLAAAGKLQPGVATNKRCIDQYIQILGKYKEKPDAANSCDVMTEQQQKLSSMLAKSRELQGVSPSADTSEFASFQSVWRKQEIEVVYSKARTGSSSSEQCRSEPPTAIIDDTNILPEELAILELSDADHLLVFRADNEDGPYLRGGTVVALIVHACSVRTAVPSSGTQRFTVLPEEHAQFQRVFLATYRTLISSERLCEMLVRRYLHFAKADYALLQQLTTNSSSQTVSSSSTQPAPPAASSKSYQEIMDGTAKFLLAVVNELGSDLVPSSDRENSLVNSLCNFTTQLMEQYNNIKLANAIHSRVFEILNGLHQTKITQPLVSLYAVPETCSTEQIVSTLLQFRSVDIAQQLTIIDAELFGRIETKELLIWAQDQNEELCPNFTSFSEQFNNLSYWTRSLILSQLLHDLNANANRDRERLIVKFIKIMKHLRKLNNFNAFIALAAALGSAPVRRLEWSRSIQEAIDEFSLVIDSSSSFKNYRHALQQALQQISAFNCAGMSSSMHSNAGSEKASQSLSTGSATDAGNCQVTSLIPYIGVMLTDLTFIHQGNKSYLNQKEGDKRPLWQVPVNMWKRWQQFNSLDVFIRIKQMRYVGLARDEKILRCFNGFKDFLDEDQQWTLFETIKSKI